MLVREIMTDKVKLLNPEMSLNQAASRMKEDDIGVLPVGENDRLVGMLTDRDIVVRGLAEKRDPATTKVRDAMSTQVLYCFEDEPVEQAAESMARARVRRLPVLNRDKRLVGIVSLGDIATHANEKKAGEALEKISEDKPH